MQRVLCWEVGSVSSRYRRLLEGEEPGVPGLRGEEGMVPALSFLPLNAFNNPTRKISLL